MEQHRGVTISRAEYDELKRKADLWDELVAKRSKNMEEVNKEKYSTEKRKEAWKKRKKNTIRAVK
jgi:hypothetical protein